MHKRTLAVLLGAILLLALGALGCATTRLIARAPAVTTTPTRTPRPTWTPAGQVFQVATPTLDATRYPGVVLPGADLPTPQILVPGSSGPIFVPVPAEGVTGVQTLVVVVVTATPQPTATWTPGPPTATPGPTWTPAPTPTATGTPLPPVTIEVTVDKANVRQGPGVAYPVVTRLDAGTRVTVVGRNRNGDWWKICCVNGADVWIADSVVKVDGPLWAVAEISNVPPPPPTAIPSPTPQPTPTYAWPFRLLGKVQEYTLGQDYFRVDGVIYNGATPLFGYKLRIRKTSTGEQWLSAGSQTSWIWYVLQYPDDNKPVNPTIDCPNPRAGVSRPLVCLRSNVKWDSNGVGVPMGDDIWEVTATDGAGTPLSQPVRVATSAGASKWYYIVFTSQP